MKKIILALGVLTGLGLHSCQDAYDITQPGQIHEEEIVLRSSKDAYRYLLSFYRGLPAEGFIHFTSRFTDELGIGAGNGNQGISDRTYLFHLTSGDSFANSFWSAGHALISRINSTFIQIDRLIKIAKGNELNELNAIKSQMYLMRAYIILNQHAYYTTNYTDLKGLSVAKFDFFEGINQKARVKRNTVDEIVKFIEADIAEALKFNFDNSEKNKFLNKDFANGLLVKLYSMSERYDDLEAAFAKISGYSIGNYKSYVDVFHGEGHQLNNKDVIFRLGRVFADNFNIVSFWNNESSFAARAAFYEIGRSLYNELDKLDNESLGKNENTPRNDARWYVNNFKSKIATNYKNLPQADFRRNDILFIGKYPGSAGKVRQNDINIMRYTDLYLLTAEAKAAKGDFAGVKTIIENVRKARAKDESKIVVPVINDSKSAWKAILDERRVELAFEGARYIDVKRIGKKAGMEILDRDPKDMENALNPNTKGLPINDFRMTLPIPQREKELNPDLVQNPGY